MTEATWRPLGVETEDDVVAYDALHDGVPQWMEAALWAWIEQCLRKRGTYPDGSGSFPVLDVALAEALCQTLKIPLPSMTPNARHPGTGRKELDTAVACLRRHGDTMQIVDFLLAHGGQVNPSALEETLERCKSVFTVGERSGRPGLLRRVPLGVQLATDAVIRRGGNAGIRLASAWEKIYGVTPDPSAAYRLAIQAVEDAAVPVVSPTNMRATLGTVISDVESQVDWRLPMVREDPRALTGDLVLRMMRALWNGQHDRHGGQPSAPGNVSTEEARVAVALAVALVALFTDGLVTRTPAAQSGSTPASP